MPIYTAEEYEQKHGHKIKRHPLPDDCATSNYPRLIHKEETWRFLQTVFFEQTYARKSYHYRLFARNKHLWYSGVDDNYVEARDGGDGRGRGMYAIKDIPAGTKVWYFRLEWVVNDGYWDTKEKLINFLERLPHDLQCDVILWAYASVSVRKGTMGKFVECNLDEASFFNHAERPELVNIVHNVAVRDIKKGEELLMDYGSFMAMGEESIPWWDEIRSRAWKEVQDEDIVSGNQDAEKVAIANRSSSADTIKVGIQTNSESINSYVKYGAPKTSSTAGGSVFVDARSMHGGQATSFGFLSTLVGIYLAWVSAQGLLVTMGMRRRR